MAFDAVKAVENAMAESMYGRDFRRLKTSPYTVGWIEYNELEDTETFHLSQVFAFDPNDAIVDVALKEGVSKAELIRVLFVIYGHGQRQVIEADDRFSWWNPQ